MNGKRCVFVDCPWTVTWEGDEPPSDVMEETERHFRQEHLELVKLLAELLS